MPPSSSPCRSPAPTCTAGFPNDVPSDFGHLFLLHDSKGVPGDTFKKFQLYMPHHVIEQHKTNDSAVRCVEFSSEANCVVTGGWDAQVKLSMVVTPTWVKETREAILYLQQK